MADINLRCPTCPDPFPAPVVDGVVTISPQTLSVVQTSQGARFMPLCQNCADSIFGGSVEVNPS